MSLGFSKGSVVAAAGQQIAFSSILSSTGTNNPAYVVVSGLDRLEYTAASNGNQGTITGNGNTIGYTSTGGDATGLGIMFTYNASSGQYVNSTYGNLSSLVLTASTDKTRTEAISLYGSNDASLLSQYKNNPVSLAVYASSSYLGTLDVVTQPSYGTAPAQATPNSIAAIAQSFVGQAWNNSGCWVLASNIAAEAGASLPVISTLTGIAGQANGEWMVAYNGPVSSSTTWQSTLRTGDVVVFTNTSGGGHITTVAAGSGTGAQLIDNIEYVNSSGAIVNAANDGSASDVLVSAAHAASAEFNGVNPASVVVYRLDTPVITAAASNLGLAAGQVVSLGAIVSAADPAGKAIAAYQVYDTNTRDSFTVNGAAAWATNAGNALTLSASSFSSALFDAGTGMSGVASGALMVRAFNGTYWGDWTQVSVSVTPSSVADTAADIVSTLSSLNAAFVAGALSTIRFTDSGKPVLTLTAAQFTTYRALLNRITGSYTVAVTASSAPSTLTGTSATNLFSAGSMGGNHILAAGVSVNGSDTLMGGFGADVLYGSTSASGAAVLVAGSGANSLYGGVGADSLYGGGRSLLIGGAANQLLLGGYTATSRDTLSASSAGHDFLAVSAGNNLLSVGTGTGNLLEGGRGADKLYGGSTTSSASILVAGSGANTVMGGLGADSLVGGGASLLTAGTGQSQLLLGGFSANAHDTLSAGSNNAVLAVANGNNVLQAGTGASTLFGGAGADLLQGGGGSAVMVGGTGFSTIMAGSGSDTLVGSGQSLLMGGSGTGGTSLLLGGYSSSAHDTLVGGTGGGETLAVSTGNNSLYADPTGQASGDLLIAGTGNDTLYGSGYGSGAGGAATTQFNVGLGANTAVLGGAGNDNVSIANGNGHVFFDGGAGTNTVTFAGNSDANASISTAASGETTISFNNSAQTVTLDNVRSVAFANGAVHQLAA